MKQPKISNDRKNFSALTSKVIATPNKPIIQDVAPIKEPVLESKFTFHLPTDKLKKLKLISAQREISIKDLINSALDDKYFTEGEK